MKGRVVITGAAGLVGQNLIVRLKRGGYDELVAIDKHPTNTALLRRIHPDIIVIEADLAEPGDWVGAFEGATAVVLNQAQIGGLNEEEFIRNNQTATEHIVAAMRRFSVPYFVHISSSVVHSQADDFYTRSKLAQEKFIDTVTDIPHVVLRPTLMFGWFDRKHLGWLRRFMDRTPVFPIPGNGRYLRQPLYAGDFAAVIHSALDRRCSGTFDISGQEKVDYIDLIRLIHRTVKPKARIVPIPYGLFWILLWAYALFFRSPPFTTRQLEALVIPEIFPLTDWPKEFSVSYTPLSHAIAKTFLDPKYSSIILDF